MRKAGNRKRVKSSGVSTAGAVIALFGAISAVVGIFEFAGAKIHLIGDKMRRTGAKVSVLLLPCEV